MQEEQRRIIRERAGELGYVDLHRVPRDAFLDPPKGDVHLVGVVCICARLAWAKIAARTKPAEHPFEAMLLNLGIKRRYTRPYRPQTTGKIERFWRTPGDDMIDGTTFDDLNHVSDELFRDMIYYNEMRPHPAFGGISPKAFLAPLTPN